jgi:hypothetical protein
MVVVVGWIRAKVARQILATIGRTSIHQSRSRSEMATITGCCNELIAIFGYVRMALTTDDVPIPNEI